MKQKILKGLLCFIPTVIGSVFWNVLPEKVVTHIGLFGADGFSSKFFVVFISPAIFFIIHIIAVIIEEKHPDWLGLSHSKKTRFNYMLPVISFLFFLIAIINS